MHPPTSSLPSGQRLPGKFPTPVPAEALGRRLTRANPDPPPVRRRDKRGPGDLPGPDVPRFRSISTRPVVRRRPVHLVICAACPYMTAICALRAPDDYPQAAEKRSADYMRRAVSVFPGLYPDTTCGRAVNKPVDNHRQMRITARVLWIPCGWRKIPEMAGRRPLRGVRGGSNNAFTVGNGHHLGLAPGTREEPGDRSARAGTWPRRAARGVGKASQLAGLARRGRVRPLHLIHGGALPDSARQERLCQAGTPATAVMPAATTWGRDRARARSPGGRAGPEPPRRQQTGAGPPECWPARPGAASSRVQRLPGRTGRPEIPDRTARDLGGRGAVVTRAQARLRVVIEDLAASLLGARPGRCC